MTITGVIGRRLLSRCLGQANLTNTAIVMAASTE